MTISPPARHASLRKIAVFVGICSGITALSATLPQWSAAQTHGTSDPLIPGRGEVRLIGTIQPAAETPTTETTSGNTTANGGSDATETRLSLLVTRVMGEDGTINDLNPPRSKSLIVRNGTSLFALNSGGSNALKASDLTPQRVVWAVVPNRGTGSPLFARAVGIDLTEDVHHDHSHDKKSGSSSKSSKSHSGHAPSAPNAPRTNHITRSYHRGVPGVYHIRKVIVPRP